MVKEGERVHIPCEEVADKLRDQAITSNGSPGPGGDMDGALVPGVVVEFTYPRVIQITGGSNERRVWQDEVSILHSLEDSQGVLGQPDSFEYLPGVGLCPVVDEIEEQLHLGQFILGRLAAPLEGNSTGLALVCPVLTGPVGEKAMAAGAPGTAAVALERMWVSDVELELVMIEGALYAGSLVGGSP